MIIILLLLLIRPYITYYLNNKAKAIIV